MRRALISAALVLAAFGAASCSSEPEPTASVLDQVDAEQEAELRRAQEVSSAIARVSAEAGTGQPALQTTRVQQMRGWVCDDRLTYDQFEQRSPGTWEGWSSPEIWAAHDIIAAEWCPDVQG